MTNKTIFVILVFSIFTNSLGTATKHEGEKIHERVINKELSDKQHYSNGSHNAEYDHDAFLGGDAKKFEGQSAEESKRKLGLIFHKIDANADDLIDHEELKDWIKFTQRKYMRDNVDRTWKTHISPGKDKISWKEYSSTVFEFMKGLSHEELNKADEGISYNGLYERDLRRWHAADTDGDEYLVKEEFFNFLHPEESPKLHHLVILETIEDIDKDGDGKISLEEYVADMYQEEDNEEKPQWLHDEIKQFSSHRDKNGDGYLDSEEVKEWVIPVDFDHADSEATHLIREADKNGDQKLTKDEVVQQYDLFVGSQATDFGEVLLRHDEF